MNTKAQHLRRLLAERHAHNDVFLRLLSKLTDDELLAQHEQHRAKTHEYLKHRRQSKRIHILATA